MTRTLIFDDASPAGSWANELSKRGLDPKTGTPKEHVPAAVVEGTYQGMADTGFKVESGGKPGEW